MKRPYFFVQAVAALVSVSMLTTVSYAQQKTAKACEAEWRASKTTLQAAGKKKKDFITECRAGTEHAAAPAQAAPAAPPAQAAAPASLQANAAPNAPAKTATAKTEETAAPSRTRRTRTATRTAATPTAGQYATEAEAKTHCPDDTVVWANTRSKVYHFAGSRTYGKTKAGAYMCEKDTVAAGIRSAKNEKRK